MAGVVGGLGTFFGGYLSQRLARRDMAWLLRLPALATLLALPFSIGFYLVSGIRANRRLTGPKWRCRPPIIIAHTAGYTPFLPDRTVDFLAAQLERYREGAPLENLLQAEA